MSTVRVDITTSRSGADLESDREREREREEGEEGLCVLR